MSDLSTRLTKNEFKSAFGIPLDKQSNSMVDAVQVEANLHGEY